MLTNRLAAKYARAVFELAVAKNRLDEVETQLQFVENMLHEHKDFNAFFYHPRVPAVVKKAVISKIFATDLTTGVYNFMMLLIDKRREKALPRIISEYTKLANQQRNMVEAEITTACILSETDLQDISAKLGVLTEKIIVPRVHIDKSILGGIIVKMGDKLIDGSVVRQVKTLQSILIKC
jgi:F-type H+-transporting ATPase subunit delta